jgi:Icc-related predicted phosphoesterase
MKIVIISDQHGNLPKLPSCDLLLVCGDICPVWNHNVDFQQYWIETDFKYWLRDIEAKKKIFIAGNHDFVFQKRPNFGYRLRQGDYPATYLEDSITEYEGLKIYGSPWTNYFYDWAFNLYEQDLKEKWKLIPNGTDIIVTHGPPRGFGDLAPRTITDENEEQWPAGEHVGSISLLEKIDEIKPRLVVYGHIHSGYGVYSFGETMICNASLLNEKYELQNKPIVVSVKDKIFQLDK